MLQPIQSRTPVTGDRAPHGETSAILTRQSTPATHRRTSAPFSAPAAWLVAPTFMAATGTGILLVMRGPDRYFGLALATLFGLAIVWILISVFFPASVDRTCPACGREDLRRLDRDTTRGVICDTCGHVDSDQSSFLFAEEEGPLESIVLAERKGPGKTAGRGGTP